MLEMADPIQQPLSLVLQLKSSGPAPQPTLLKLIDPSLPDILHFAWLIALDDKGKLLLSTVYDGDFDLYLDKFIDSSHAAFDAFFPLLKDGPPTPVLQNRQAFHDFVRKNNISPIPGTFFSAYPTMNVVAIQNC
jgi:hypothetical protein